jgi:hypothetical protein
MFHVYICISRILSHALLPVGHSKYSVEKASFNAVGGMSARGLGVGNLLGVACFDWRNDFMPRNKLHGI